MILKTIAWTWLGIVVLVTTGLSLWAVLRDLSGVAGFMGFIWLFLILGFSLILAVKIILDEPKGKK